MSRQVGKMDETYLKATEMGALKASKATRTVYTGQQCPVPPLRAKRLASGRHRQART
jgi:hypothetical protein